MTSSSKKTADTIYVGVVYYDRKVGRHVLVWNLNHHLVSLMPVTPRRDGGIPGHKGLTERPTKSGDTVYLPPGWYFDSGGRSSTVLRRRWDSRRWNRVLVPPPPVAE